MRNFVGIKIEIGDEDRDERREDFHIDTSSHNNDI